MVNILKALSKTEPPRPKMKLPLGSKVGTAFDPTKESLIQQGFLPKPQAQPIDGQFNAPARDDDDDDQSEE